MIIVWLLHLVDVHCQCTQENQRVNHAFLDDLKPQVDLLKPHHLCSLSDLKLAVLVGLEHGVSEAQPRQLFS